MGSENSKGENKERSKPSTRQNSSSLPQTHPTTERARNPYNFTSDDLQTHRSTTSLYPNLQNANRTLTPEQRGPAVTPESRHPYCHIGLGGRSDAEEFVLINNFGQQRSYPKPSAPPEPEVTVTERPQVRPTRPPPPRVDSPTPSTSAFANTSSNNTAPNTKTRSDSRFDSPSPSTSAFANTSSNNTRSNTKTRSESWGRHADRYNCSTCSQRLGLTIFQCNNQCNSHSSCSECRHNNRFCGICRYPIIGMRNIVLEGLIAELQVHNRTVCPNDGCTLSFNDVDMMQHQKACPFGETNCPMGTLFGKCSHRYKVEDIAAHFDANHKEQRCADFGKEMFIFNICMESQKMFLVKNGPYNFLVHIKVAGQDRTVYMAVQLYGTAMSASKWTYEFHVYKKSQPRRKFLYVDTCQSISTSVDDIFKESKCATLPLSYAKSFVTESALTYKFYIKKNEIGQKRRRNGKAYWKRQDENE